MACHHNPPLLFCLRLRACGVSVPVNLQARVRALFAPKTAAFACSAGALLVALFDAVLRADLVRFGVALPLALGLAVLTYAPACALAIGLGALQRRGWALPLWVGLLVAVSGGVSSNVLLVDLPFDPATMVGYAISLVVGAAAALGVRRADLGLSSRWVAAALAASCGMLLAADAFAEPVQYPGPHAALRVVLAPAVTASLLLFGVPRRAAAASLVAAFVVGALAFVPSSRLRASVFALPTFERYVAVHLLETRARATLLRVIGGHECELGGGRTVVQGPCPGAPVALPWANAAPLTTAGTLAPVKIVLLTVDAIRCGAHERVPFADACPTLAQKVVGAHVGTVRVSYPATGPSITDLHGGRYDSPATGERTSWLAGALSARGYTAVAVVTHRRLRIEPVVRSFDEWDDRLIDHVAVPTQASSPTVSARVLAHLQCPGRGFVWAHYIDPHDPYLRAEGSRFTGSSIAAYLAELARTDAAIGVVLDAVAARGEPAVVVITGDHGEAFGEHGATHHGYQLYDEAVRIPFVVRSFHGALLPAELPRQSVDLFSWLTAVAGGTAFDPQPPTPARARQLWSITDGAEKLILDRETGWIEVYDLARDPRETRNLAEASPERTQRLLAGLSAALRR